MGSFFKKIAAYFKQHFANVTTSSLASDAHAAKVALDLLAPGAILALQQAGVEENSAEVQNVVAEVEKDLALVDNVLSEMAVGQPAPAELKSALEAIKTNLPSILTAAHIKNPQTLQTVTNATNAFVQEVEVILSEFFPA